MYPLKFENIYVEKVWGSRYLELIRDNLPQGAIGESWDVACHRHGTSVISNGKYKGLNIKELIEQKGEKLLGTKISTDRFPLLIKLLSPNQKLSVQVHPNDDFAMKMEGEMGKTEAWYIVDADENAKIILGTSGCTKEEFTEGIQKGNPENYMNEIKVKKGDLYFVKSGLIHTIGGGITIAEIQQNSDTTYRVYDYNRGRDLHIEKALNVIDFKLEGKKSPGLKVERNGYSKTYYCLNSNFSIELYDVKESFQENSDKERFYVFTCVEGQGKIEYVDGVEEIKKGDSLLIPADMGSYRIVGNIKLLKSYVPDEEKVSKEVLDIIRE